MNFILDTNILLHYVRGTKMSLRVENEYSLFEKGNNLAASVVTIGEIKSIAKRNYWGIKKLHLLEKLLNLLIIIDINAEDIIERYAEIDAFSQNKIKDNPLPMTARNMGKNDLWIAATASVTNATLLTKKDSRLWIQDSRCQLAMCKEQCAMNNFPKHNFT